MLFFQKLVVNLIVKLIFKFYSPIIQKLLETTNRADGNSCNLRAAAYEAVMEMIKNSPEDCYDTVLSTTHEIMRRIDNLFAMEANVGNDQRSQARFIFYCIEIYFLLI